MALRDLASGATATNDAVRHVGSVFDNWDTPANAIDGNNGTQCCVGGGSLAFEAWLNIDLGAAYRVEYMQLLISSTPGLVDLLAYSTDGTTWHNIAYTESGPGRSNSITNPSSPGNKFQFPAPIDARYFSLRAAEGAGGFQTCCVATAQVWGDDIPPPPDPVVCEFSATPLWGSAPLEVTFTDESTGDPDSWLWDFGDGETSTDQNPTHVYAEPGVYTVALTAHRSDDDDECTETKVDYVTVLDPQNWDVYAADALLGPPIASLANASGRYIRSALHDVGEGGFAINRHATEATEAILAQGNMVKVRIPDCGPDYLDGFFLGPDGDYTLLSVQGGKGKEHLTFKGPGALDYLDRARMTPCAFSVDTTVDTWTEQWATNVVPFPSGTAWISSDPTYIYVASQRSRRIYKVRIADQVVVGMSPVLWSGSTHWLGGLASDPSDATILWALETPWAAGSSDNTKIRKISIAAGIAFASVAATIDLGSAITHSAIKADATVLFLSRYSTSAAAHSVYTRHKTTGAVISSGTVTFNGTVQTKCSGISVNGTDVALWFAGTQRALLSTTAAPRTVVGSISTRTIASFGGDWFTSGGNEYFAMDSYTAGTTWLYQLTANVPQCADASGVFHPEQTSPGALAWRVLVEITHVDRPVQECPELSYDFTEDEDSNGTPWPTRTSTEEFTWRVGDRAYSDVLSRLIPAGVTFDLDVNTMTLHAYVDADFGTDRTSGTFGAGKVRFEEGVNLGVNADLSKRDNRGLPATYITVAGDNGVYGSASLAGPYERSGFMQVSGVSTEAVLDAIGADELARQRLVAEAAGFSTLWPILKGVETFDDLALIGRYVPKLHYWKGDLVTVDMVASEFAYEEAGLRVYGTLISERDKAGGGWRVALDLGSAYKIPPPVTNVGGQGTTSSGSDATGGGSSSGGPAVPPPPLYVIDPLSGVIIPNVTVLKHDGAYSPTPGTAVLPRGSTETADDLPPGGGAIVIPYIFSTTTTDADPGSGAMRLSNATQYLAVTARLDLADVLGADVTNALDALAGAISTVKAYLRIQHAEDESKWLLATVSAIASPSGYRNVTIANIAKSANSPFANGDPVIVSIDVGSLATTHAALSSIGVNDHHNRDHAATHGPAAADALKLDDLATPDDNTDLDASTARHGLLRKLPGGTTDFLRADGAFASPGGGSALTVEEVDGSPTDAAITKIVFPNDSVSIAAHVATVRQVPFGFVGVALTKGSNLAMSTSGEGNLTLDTEVWKSDAAFHSNVTNNHLVTIPAGLGGKYRVTLHGQVSANQNCYLVCRKGVGGTIVALGTEIWNSSQSVGQCADSADVDLAAGDVLEFKQLANGASNLVVTWPQVLVSVVKLDAGRVGSGIGAGATKNAAQSVPNATFPGSMVTFPGTDSFDTDAIHDPSSNSSRHTIPPGLGGKYLALFGLSFASHATGERIAWLYKNGNYVNQIVRTKANSVWDTMFVGSYLIDLAAGDYVEVMPYQDSGGALNVTTDTYFQLIRIDSGGTEESPWTAYTPALTASTTNPTLGSGSIASARYKRIGKTVHVQGRIGFGSSGVSAGSGEYRVSLPPGLPLYDPSTPTAFGQVTMYDNSAGVPFTFGAVYGGVSPANTYVRFAISTGAVIMGDAAPQVWAANDYIIFNFTYETA